MRGLVAERKRRRRSVTADALDPQLLRDLDEGPPIG
jgi:hypothetical protein